MALINKSQQSKTNKAGNFSGGILQLQVPFLNVARMLLYRIQYNIIESKCQVRIFVRICVPEKIELVIINSQDTVQHIHISLYQTSLRVIFLLSPIIVFCTDLQHIFENLIYQCIFIAVMRIE